MVIPPPMTPEEAYEEALRRIRLNHCQPAVLSQLSLTGCEQLAGDSSPLTGLTSLQSLNLCHCLGFRRFAPLESLLPTLEKLYCTAASLMTFPLKSAAKM